MRAWATLFFPIVFLNLLVVILWVAPASGSWAQHSSVSSIPYLLAAATIFLGLFFTQTRVTFLALLFTAVSFMLSYWTRNDEPTRAAAAVFLAGIYVPPIAVMLFYFNERGLFNSHGLIRLGIVLSVILPLILLPNLASLYGAFEPPVMPALRPLGKACSLPLPGIVLGLASVVTISLRRRNEGMMGPTYGAALLFFLLALNFQCGLWKPAQQHTALILLMSGAMATLLWSVLESSWRNLHLDELTELPGRRSLKYHLARLGQSYCIALLDIDHFKRINDRYGHPTGDQVLRYLSAHLRQVQAGRAYRYGGEEFVIVCEHGTFEENLEAMERLRKTISARPFWIRGKDRPKSRPEHHDSERGESSHSEPRRRGGESITVTVSIGVAREAAKYASPQEVLEAADKALYKAKQEGRDRVKAAR